MSSNRFALCFFFLGIIANVGSKCRHGGVTRTVAWWGVAASARRSLSGTGMTAGMTAGTTFREALRAFEQADKWPLPEGLGCALPEQPVQPVQPLQPLQPVQRRPCGEREQS